MNVRLENQNIRFKITGEELEKLLRGDCLHIDLNLLDKNLIALINPKGLADVMEAKLAVDEEDIYLSLLVPPDYIQKLANMGRSKEGLQQEIGKLTITLQVDLKSDKRQKVDKA